MSRSRSEKDLCDQLKCEGFEDGMEGKESELVLVWIIEGTQPAMAYKAGYEAGRKAARQGIS